MKYFIDTEFHERGVKPIFGKRVNTIELISIGIVAEDQRKLYLISKEFDIKAAYSNEWLRENVLRGIYYENRHNLDTCPPFNEKNLTSYINSIGKTNIFIRKSIELFVTEDATKPSFYGYYSDYDWVVFCWLWGRMIDLPKIFPMYCIDIKQTIDEVNKEIANKIINKFTKEETKDLQEPAFTIAMKRMKAHKDYPKQKEGEQHNALHDAEWNMELFKFINARL